MQNPHSPLLDHVRSINCWSVFPPRDDVSAWITCGSVEMHHRTYPRSKHCYSMIFHRTCLVRSLVSYFDGPITCDVEIECKFLVHCFSRFGKMKDQLETHHNVPLTNFPPPESSKPWLIFRWGAFMSTTYKYCYFLSSKLLMVKEMLNHLRFFWNYL